MSPSTLPSICTSPADISVPRTTNSLLMMEGAPPLLRGRLGCTVGAGATGVGSGSLLFENIATCLDELFGVFHRLVIPHFVMDVRACAAPRRTEPADNGTLVHLSSQLSLDLCQMSIACTNPVAVIDFHGVAIVAVFACEYDNTGSRRAHFRPFRAGKINAGMECQLLVEGIQPSAKIAADAAQFRRRKQRNRFKRAHDLVELSHGCRGFRHARRETDVVSLRCDHERDERPALGLLSGQAANQAFA